MAEEKMKHNKFRSKEEIDVKEKLKTMSVKEKMVYYFEYYRVQGIVGIIVIAVIFSFIYNRYINPPPEPIFNNVIYTEYVSEEDIQIINERVSDVLVIDSEKEKVVTSLIMVNMEDMSVQYQASMLVGARITARDIDVIIMKAPGFEEFLETGSFLPIDDAIKEGLITIPEEQQVVMTGTDGVEAIYGVKLAPELNNLDVGEEMYAGIIVNSEHIESGYKTLEVLGNNK